MEAGGEYDDWILKVSPSACTMAGVCRDVDGGRGDCCGGGNVTTGRGDCEAADRGEGDPEVAGGERNERTGFRDAVANLLRGYGTDECGCR